jgi:light-regulated signal transduction histidine kinase (bacteriophytochrome)
MRRGEAIQGRISQISPEQAQPLAHWGVRSFMNAPILIDDELWGLIGFYDSKTERNWSQAEIDAILIAAGLLGAAIHRQNADERIHRMNAELENRVRERTADLESFAYSVAHDLRAPLRGIDGYSKLLLDEYGHLLASEGQIYLDNVRHGAQFMGQLIEDLLKLSRVTRLEMRNTLVNLSQIARETCASLQAQSPGRKIQWTVHSDMYVVGDPTLLRLSLDNLLLNAWKFTNQKESACIEVGFYDQDNRRIYYVRDDGVGFDMRYADKLFGPFQRLHQPGEFEGTGIGLATVKRIIQRHNGEIWAEGAVGVGATFYFTIPS